MCLYRHRRLRPCAIITTFACALAITCLFAILPPFITHSTTTTYSRLVLSDSRVLDIVRHEQFGRTSIIATLSKTPRQSAPMHDRWTSPNIHYVTSKRELPYWLRFDPPMYDPMPTWRQRDDVVGFPLRWLQATAVIEITDVVGFPVQKCGLALDQPPTPSGDFFPDSRDMLEFCAQTRMLPTKPLVTRLLLNVVLIVLVIAVGDAIVLFSQTWFRLVGGRCASCGYRLRGGSTKRCSECGWNRSPNEGQRPPQAEPPSAETLSSPDSSGTESPPNTPPPSSPPSP